MKMNNKNFVLVPNVAFAFGRKYHLNKDEFMVYVHLQFTKQVGLTNTTRTNVEMLIEDLGWETSTKSRDKANMVKILEGLQEKGYIKIKFKDKILKSNLTIYHSFKELEEMQVEVSATWKPTPLKFNGFTKVYGEEYNLAENNGYYMMVIAYIAWRTNPALKYEYKICFKEWESILDVSDKTARKIIDGCTSFINKILGIHYKDESGQIRQEPNGYELKTRQENTSIKSKIEEVEHGTYLEKLREQVTDLEVKFDDETFNQIFDKGTFIELKGYKAWRETECPVVKEVGQKKFDALKASKNEYAQQVQEKLEREYQEHLIHQEKRHSFIERMMSQHLEQEYESNYKPKKQEETCIFED